MSTLFINIRAAVTIVNTVSVTPAVIYWIVIATDIFTAIIFSQWQTTREFSTEAKAVA
jgi:hypothetical protein